MEGLEGNLQGELDEAEDNRFSVYRESYLKDRLRSMGITEESEVTASLEFVDGRTDDKDDNLEEVFSELKVRMRLKQRERRYVDPSMGNGISYRPKPDNLESYGRKMYDRLSKKGLV